jgi:predicted RNA binding protein YcfA (HicA-like mRNA interferase family)
MYIDLYNYLIKQIATGSGSHIRMKHQSDRSKKPLTIPNHSVVGKGLLRKLLRDAEITIEDFSTLL